LRGLRVFTVPSQRNFLLVLVHEEVEPPLSSCARKVASIAMKAARPNRAFPKRVKVVMLGET